MKRISVFLIVVAVVAGMVGCDGNSDGPPSENVEIRDWYDLDAIRNDLTGSYILMNDLDSTTAGYDEVASPTANGGNGWQPIGNHDYAFGGNFNGQSYEISDLFINRPFEDEVGLFGFVAEGGAIEDVGAVNADVTGGDLVGGLVGFNYGGTVSNCHSSGWVTANDSAGGGSGGNTVFGIVVGCFSTCTVNGNSNIGGLVGWNGGNITDSYCSGNVTGNYSVGGLVGWNGGTVSKCYSMGTVNCEEHVGGLVGFSDYGIVTNCFWDTETSGQAISAGGTGKTTAQMQDIDTFSRATWNITRVANPDTRNLSYIWNIVDDMTYPFLSWQRIS